MNTISPDTAVLKAPLGKEEMKEMLSTGHQAEVREKLGRKPNTEELLSHYKRKKGLI